MSVVIQGTRPLASLNGSVALTSGVAPGFLMHRLFLNVSAATVSVTTADGTTVSLGSLTGVIQLDIEFTSVTFSAGTAVGFYAIEG